MEKAIVIYDTKFVNTEKIARALARGMEMQGVKVARAKAFLGYFYSEVSFIRVSF